MFGSVWQRVALRRGGSAGRSAPEMLSSSQNHSNFSASRFVASGSSGSNDSSRALNSVDAFHPM